MVNNSKIQDKALNPELNQAPDKIIEKVSKRRYFTTYYPKFNTILALLALGIASYSVYQNRQAALTNTVQKQQLTTMVTHYKQEYRGQLLKTKQALQNKQLTLQQQLNILQSNLKIALDQSIYQKQDWLLLKARYYLEIAQITAHWSRDYAAIIVLLQEADRLLQTLSDQRVFNVRQAIASELTQIKALPKLDIVGLLSQLDAVQEMIGILPTKTDINHLSKNPVKEDANKALAFLWKGNLKESMNFLKKLVVIHHQESEIKFLPSPLQQTLVKESIRMNLQKTQWALLQNNSAIYHQSLQQVIKDISLVFIDKSPAIQALIQELHDLQQIVFATTKPVITQSLFLLNELIDNPNPSFPVANNRLEGNNK